MKPTMTRGELRVIADTDHAQCGDAATMANMLLAVMEIEPVYQCWCYTTVENSEGDQEDFWFWNDCDKDFFDKIDGKKRMLYTAPPAQVAVPDEKWVNPDIGYVDENGFAEGWNESRQHAVNNGKVPPVVKGISAYCRGWNAFRAAMLKAGPVTASTVPDGWKLVPVEPTEEMCKAGYEAQDKWRSEQCDNFKERRYSFSQPRYKAMINAAPAAPGDDL